MVNHCLLKPKCGHTMAGNCRKRQSSQQGKPGIYAEIYDLRRGVSPKNAESVSNEGQRGKNSEQMARKCRKIESV
jgi:hypothetical protein